MKADVGMPLHENGNKKMPTLRHKVIEPNPYIVSEIRNVGNLL